MKGKQERHEFRKQRTRDRLRQAVNGLPRLCVRRSLKYIYAQVIDDQKGATLASADSFEEARKHKKKSCKSMEDAKAVGRSIAQKAIKAGVQKVVFDRGALVYHGRLKALADAARESGLKF